MRDVENSGKLAGFVLAELLCRLVDGTPPVGIFGAARAGGGDVELVLFPEGAMLDALSWLATPGLVDPIFVNADAQEVRVHVPHDASGQTFAFVVIVRFAVDRGGLVSTSLPGFIVDDEDDDDAFDAFQEGLAEGLEEHPRTEEVRRGFGALGDYE